MPANPWRSNPGAWASNSRFYSELLSGKSRLLGSLLINSHRLLLGASRGLEKVVTNLVTSSIKDSHVEI